MTEREEQTIPWEDDLETGEAAAPSGTQAAGELGVGEDGGIAVGEFHGPELPPQRFVTFQDSAGRECRQELSQEGWKKFQQLKRSGYVKVNTSNRRQTRANTAERRREERRRARHGRRPAT